MMKMNLRTLVISAGVLCAPLVVMSADKTKEARIEKQAREFSSTNYLDDETVQKIRRDNILAGFGEATYALDVPATGWYELYVQAGEWATDLYLDGEFIIHTPFDSGVWEPGENGAHKVMNLYLQAGQRNLKFSRPWLYGLPYMRGFYLRASDGLAGMVRLSPTKDYLVFRRGESFPVILRAGMQQEAQKIFVNLIEQPAGKIWETMELTVPSGRGVHEEELAIPTGREGVFDISVVDGAGGHLDRIIQYCVVDTERPAFPQEMRKELVEVVDAVAREPDFTNGATRTVNSPIGSYRESGDTGKEKGAEHASWFAYTLNLPSIQEPYVLELEYPDDERRTTPILLVESMTSKIISIPPGQGYSSGGFYPLSNRMQTQEFFFFPRESDPRVMFFNWNSGQRAAVSKINVYRITGGFPSLRYGREGRMFGMFQEEPMRFTDYFGAMSGDAWPNIHRCAERMGQLTNYAGINLWYQTIAIYQHMIWPGKTIPGYRIGTLPPGPTTTKEPFKKDVMRLILLVAEKYGLNFIGDLHMPPNWILMRHLDQRFGGDGTFEDDGHHKPWLTVSNRGEVGLKSNRHPYYNPIHPGVQEWVAEVFSELAERYQDSPVFKGVSIRFMGWSFGGWQTFASIEWGYEDYTVNLFEKDTGVNIPVDNQDPQRFRQRYEWLMSNAYQQWVDWRCGKMYEYHARLADILAGSGQDRKLYMLMFDTDFASSFGATRAYLEQKGWAGTLKEAGIDPDLYAGNPAFVFYSKRHYPDGRNTSDNQPLKKAEIRDQTASLEPLRALARPDGDGTVAAILFDQNHEGHFTTLGRLGYTGEAASNVAYPDAAVNPSGINYLYRYANAMADGNMTFISDGHHGYELGQPEYLRMFLPEYRALPDLGMRRLEGTGDPVALWHGGREGKTYFYIVNRLYEDVEVAVAFKGEPDLKRLATGARVAAEGGTFTVRLSSYQMLGYEADRPPVAMKAKAPDAVLSTLNEQVGFVEHLFSPGKDEVLSVLEMSPVEMDRARQRLLEVKEALGQGRVWAARSLLLNFDLIKLYEALAYPPGLLHRRLPPVPPGAFIPEKLKEMVVSPDGEKVAVEEGEKVSPALAGGELLSWDGDELTLELAVPFSGMYRLQYAYPLGGADDQPLRIYAGDGELVSTIPPSVGAAWVARTIPRVALRRGPVKLRLGNGAKGGRLFFLELVPLYRDILAEEFYAIGPFTGVEDPRVKEKLYARLHTVLPPEKGIDLAAEYEGFRSGKLAWVRPKSGYNVCDPHMPNFIDFYETFGVMNNVISYAATRIESPEAREAQLSFGGDYWMKIWLNGEVVKNPEVRPAASPKKGEETIVVNLRKGANTLLVKVHAGNAGNGFWCAITDPGDLSYGIKPASSVDSQESGHPEATLASGKILR